MNGYTNNLSKQTLFVFLGIIFESALIMLYNILGAKLFGVESYGDFILIFTYVTLIINFTKFGFDHSVIAFITKASIDKNETEKHNLIVFSLFFSFAISGLVSLFLYQYTDYICTNFLNNPALSELFVFQIPLIFLLTFIQISLSIFRSLNQIKIFVIIKYYLIPSLEIFAIIILFKWGIDSLSLVVSKYFSLFLAFALILFLFKKIQLSNVFKIQNIKKYKQYIVFSFPLVLSGLITLILARIDILMIGYYLDESKVGIYNIVVQISKVSLIILSTVNTIFAPIFSRLFNSQKYDHLRKTYRITTRWITFFTLIYVCEIVIFRKEIMALLGDDFKHGTTILILLTVGYFIDTSVGSVANMNTMTGRPKYNLYSNLFVIIINVIFNIILIPRYGINGAAFATMLAISLSNILKLILLYVHIKVHPFNKSYFKLFLSALLSMLIVISIKEFIINSLIINIGLSISFIVIYLFILKLMKVSNEDMLIIRKIKKIL